MPADGFDAAALARLGDDFAAIYAREYGYRLPAPVEIVGLHLIASAEVGKLELSRLPVSGAPLEAAVKGIRPVDFALAGIHATTIYDAGRLEPGMSFAGPAIVEDPGTTIVVTPGATARMDDYGNIHVTLPASEEAA